MTNPKRNAQPKNKLGVFDDFQNFLMHVKKMSEWI